MQSAIRRVFSKYATFSGRASRSEFWWWTLFVFLLIAVASFLDRLIVLPALDLSASDPDAGQPVALIASLTVVLPNIAVAMRRLHDSNRSGWWLFIALVPVLGALVLLYFYLQPSDAERNGYGEPDPLGA